MSVIYVPANARRLLSADDREMAVALLRERLSALDELTDDRFRCGHASLLEDLEGSRLDAADRSYWAVRSVAEIRRSLRDLDLLLAAGEVSPIYHMHGLFLRDVWAHLTRDENEDMAYVTGHELGRFRSLDRLVTFEVLHRGPCGVQGDPDSSGEALIRLEDHGLRLLSWVHSHPGVGPDSTQASSIDHNHQDRLERGKHPAVGAIFSRDGYVRFFSNRFPFRVQIQGAGIRRIHEHVFRLETV